MKIRYRIFLDEEAKARSAAFTVVELLIVIIVIAILATVTIVSYNGVTNRAKETSLKNDLLNTSTKLKATRMSVNSYPSSLSEENTVKSGDNQLSYTGGGTAFCLKATTPSLAGKAFYITQEGSIGEGDCPIVPVTIQTITTANCPATRTLAVDIRDNHTYWIQKLADGKCWMLTNLAYAGGGTNAYGDTRNLQNGTSGIATTYTDPKYYVSAGANPTTSPTQPSTSTDGTGQYGYLYNFCAANGGQTGNGACSNSSLAAVTTTISICPANWRLPTSNGGEFSALTTAINATSDAAGSTNLRTTWLAQYGGVWGGGFFLSGSYGNYWSSTQNDSNGAYGLVFGSSGVNPSGVNDKYVGRAVRCLVS